MLGAMREASRRRQVLRYGQRDHPTMSLSTGDQVAGGSFRRGGRGPPATIWRRKSPQGIAGSPPARKRSRCTSLKRRITWGATSGSIQSCQCLMRASPTSWIRRRSPVLSTKSRCERSRLTGDFLTRSRVSRSSSIWAVARSSWPVKLKRTWPLPWLSWIWKVGGGPIEPPRLPIRASPGGESEVKSHVGKQRCEGGAVLCPARRTARGCEATTWHVTGTDAVLRAAALSDWLAAVVRFQAPLARCLLGFRAGGATG